MSKLYDNIEKIWNVAKICHEANRAYCEGIGDNSQVSWGDAPEEIRQSAIDGVKFHMANDITPEQSHENWLKFKEAEGWVYGEVKDMQKKTHPCMIPYSELPELQKQKDKIFKAIVDCFK